MNFEIGDLKCSEHPLSYLNDYAALLPRRNLGFGEDDNPLGLDVCIKLRKGDNASGNHSINPRYHFFDVMWKDVDPADDQNIFTAPANKELFSSEITDISCLVPAVHEGGGCCFFVV